MSRRSSCQPEPAKAAVVRSLLFLPQPTWRKVFKGIAGSSACSGWRVNAGLLPEVVAAPEIQGEQRRFSGLHGVRLVSSMVDHSARGPFAPAFIRALPCGSAGEGDIDFLRLVP